MRLIDDWKRAWKFLSVQAMALVVVIQGAWAGIPDDLKLNFPKWAVTALSIGLLVFGISGRLVKQAPKDSDK